MPRRMRLHVEGAFYHVMARGNRKQQVFHEQKDYKYYLGLMQKYSERYGMEVHGYALMPNHIHLLLKVGNVPLHKFMQGLQQTYTQYFNKKNELVGHVFQGRYKDIFVDKDEYLLELIRYIHLNPVTAGLTKDPLHYPWSSHSAYYSNKANTLVHTSFVKGLLSEYGGTVIDDYRLIPEAIPRAQTSVEPAVGQSRPDKDLALINKQGRDLKQIFEAACQAADVNPDLVLAPGRVKEAVQARRIFIYLACRRAGMPIKKVAGFLGCSEVNISKSLKWVEEKGVGLKLSIITTLT